LDGQRIGTERGRYEWWYFDAHLDNGATKPQSIRNKIDLADPSQIRILRRRLGISADHLQCVVERVGNSIAAVCKEIEPQKAIRVTEPTPVQIESPSPSEVGAAVSAA
jgi:hypothetical protein